MRSRRFRLLACAVTAAVDRDAIGNVADRDGWVSYGTGRPPYSGPPPAAGIKSLHVVHYDTRTATRICN